MITTSALGINFSNVPTLNPLEVALIKDGLLEAIDDARNAYEISKPESCMFNPWFNPCAPQPTITIFLFFRSEFLFLNSSKFINLHFDN